MDTASVPALTSVNLGHPHGPKDGEKTGGSGRGGRPHLGRRRQSPRGSPRQAPRQAPPYHGEPLRWVQTPSVSAGGPACARRAGAGDEVVTAARQRGRLYYP